MIKKLLTTTALLAALTATVTACSDDGKSSKHESGKATMVSYQDANDIMGKLIKKNYSCEGDDGELTKGHQSEDEDDYGAYTNDACYKLLGGKYEGATLEREIFVYKDKDTADKFVDKEITSDMVAVRGKNWIVEVKSDSAGVVPLSYLDDAAKEVAKDLDGKIVPRGK